MKKLATLVLLLVTGCSTAPVADLLDWLRPGRLPPGQGQPYGGVCIPQGATPGGIPGGTPVIAPAPVVPPPGTTSVIPPPVPVSGPAPAPFPAR